MPESASSRQRSDSLDGLTLMDDQQQRKRPRLDSAEVGATEAGTDSSPTGNAGDQTLPSSSAQSHDSLAMTASPTSKVTINTRSLHSPTQPLLQDITASSTMTVQSNAEVLVAKAPSPDIVPEDAISISSSPSKSPEIQIAEVEDFDQDSGATTWRTLGQNRSHRILGSNYVHQTFPLARQESHPRRVGALLVKLGKNFADDRVDIGELFLQIQRWLSGLLELQDQITSEFVEYEADFWGELPELVTSLLKRDSGLPRDVSPDSFETFLIDYGRLVTHLIQLDLERLRTYLPTAEARDIQDLYCRPYLPILTWILQYKDIPLYTALDDAGYFNLTAIISTVVDELANEDGVDILHWMFELVKALAPLFPKKPALTSIFLMLLRSALPFITSISERVFRGAQSKYLESPCLPVIKTKCLALFSKADEIFQHAIVKQLPWLTMENSADFLRTFSTAFMTLANVIPELGLRLITAAGVNSSGFSAEDACSLGSYAWKFQTLRKYIVNGRMELRVHGIDEMQMDLVHVFRVNISQNPDCMNLPLVRFLVAFVRETRLVEYIIGVDSHPQLISRSTNIIGFLSVTGTYLDSDTDIMWRTVTESQDPRTVLEVLNAMKATAHPSDPPALLYFCTKLLELPIDRFDTAMISFAHNILEFLRGKLQQPLFREARNDSRPLRLCIQLLRNASAWMTCTYEQSCRIRHLAIENFSPLLPLCAGSADLEQLWLQCIEDIEADNDYATGSMEVVNTWLHVSSSGKESGPIHLQPDFTDMIVANNVHFAASCTSKPVSDPDILNAAFEIRQATLAKLITDMPQTMKPELLELLWTEILTSHTVPEFVHNQAWDQLTRIVKNCRLQSNPAIDTIIEDYLPNLQSADFDQVSLRFMQHIVDYEIQKCRDISTSDGEVVELPGISRVWSVMLEAPPNTVEGHAADFIIRKYLDHEFITRRSKSCIRATHLALVDRCVKQVITSASRLRSFTDGTMSGEDEPMVIIESEEGIRAEEMRFDRSLLFLRKFLEGMKSRPVYSPPPSNKQQPLGETFEMQGDPIETILQIFGSTHIRSGGRRLLVGRDNTGDQLWQYLTELTGFENFRTINGGRDIELKGVDRTLEALRFQPGALFVRKHEGSAERLPHRAARASSPVDSKVMDNFGELYELLDLDERLAKEVFGFLTLFPAQSSVVDSIRTRSASPDDLFPADKPYRLLYCARALRSCIEAESFSSDPDVQLLQYGVKTITSTFSRLDNGSTDDQLQVAITQSLIEILLFALRAKVQENISRSYIINHQAYVEHLLRILENSQIRNATEGALQSPLLEPFEALMEGALHDDRLWPFLNANMRIVALLKGMILEENKAEVRRAFSNVFLALSGTTGVKLVLKVNDPRAPRSRFSEEIVDATLRNAWKLLVQMLPDTTQWPSQCQELFDAAIGVFRRIGKSLPIDQISDYFEGWSDMLANHHHEEVVGRSNDDHVVSGFTKLLHECCKFIRTAEAILPDSNLSDILLSRFLFPEQSTEETGLQRSRVPVLSSNVRSDLYDLVLALNRTREELGEVSAALSDLVAKDSYFEPNVVNDRQSLRSEVGYAGLRNLANTCYLNSLFTQLFMNVRLREMLVNAKIVESPRQQLLVELGKVFSHMQNAYSRSVDPSSAVEQILTYDNEQIDVTVQMDVDEFYNLLFDRLESQFSTPEAKEAFKSLYGGQLVQQIKSKECEHISSREERFGTVQLEIKGKACLEDSLKAYVEGEVLQGDNKYKCSACARHVDAVKRACLKDVPDHLIFNLKRFDYDIMTGTRCKINDEFQFPETVDMAPYTFDALEHPEHPVDPDTFELVGVVVHTGTADSGHYYSFTRQRPSSNAKNASWVQYNDSEVSLFDPQNLRDNCFGGLETNTAFPYIRIFSAYMLFYQRKSSIQEFEMIYQYHDAANPVRIPLSPNMESFISNANELYLQSYCVQDPSHARFVRLLVDRLRDGDGIQCSINHEYESTLLRMSSDYVQQVSSRWKELPEVELTLQILCKYASQCFDCAATILEWIFNNHVVRETILRNPFPMVRRNFALLMFKSCSRLKLGRDPTSPSENKRAQTEDARTYRKFFQRCVEAFDGLWDIVPRYGRAWEEYFELLAGLVRLGPLECFIFLESGTLERVLEIVLAHIGNISRFLREKVKSFALMREKNRYFNYHQFFELLESLLDCIEIEICSEDESHEKLPNGQFGINSFEAQLLGVITQRPSRPKLMWLRKAILGGHNPAAVFRIVAKLAQSKVSSLQVLEVLELGIEDPSVIYATKFLQPILAFCQHCSSPDQIEQIVACALKAINSIGLSYGREHLAFIQSLLKLENLGTDFGRTRFKTQTLQNIAHWAPPLLLNPNDSNDDVRGDTINLLKEILFLPLQKPDIEESRKRLLMKYFRLLTEGAAFYVRDNVNTTSKDRIMLQPDQADAISKVIEYGLEKSVDDSTPVGENTIAEMNSILLDLKARAEAAAVEVLSPDWLDNESDVEALSVVSDMNTP